MLVKVWVENSPAMIWQRPIIIALEPDISLASQEAKIAAAIKQPLAQFDVFYIEAIGKDERSMNQDQSFRDMGKVRLPMLKLKQKSATKLCDKEDEEKPISPVALSLDSMKDLAAPVKYGRKLISPVAGNRPVTNGDDFDLSDEQYDDKIEFRIICKPPPPNLKSVLKKPSDAIIVESPSSSKSKSISSQGRDRAARIHFNESVEVHAEDGSMTVEPIIVKTVEDQTDGGFFTVDDDTNELILEDQTEEDRRIEEEMQRLGFSFFDRTGDKGSMPNYPSIDENGSENAMLSPTCAKTSKSFQDNSQSASLQISHMTQNASGAEDFNSSLDLKEFHRSSVRLRRAQNTAEDHESDPLGDTDDIAIFDLDCMDDSSHEAEVKNDRLAATLNGRSYASTSLRALEPTDESIATVVSSTLNTSPAGALYEWSDMELVDMVHLKSGNAIQYSNDVIIAHPSALANQFRRVCGVKCCLQNGRPLSLQFTYEGAVLGHMYLQNPMVVGVSILVLELKLSSPLEYITRMTQYRDANGMMGLQAIAIETSHGKQVFWGQASETCIRTTRYLQHDSFPAGCICSLSGGMDGDGRYQLWAVLGKWTSTSRNATQQDASKSLKLNA